MEHSPRSEIESAGRRPAAEPGPLQARAPGGKAVPAKADPLIRAMTSGPAMVAQRQALQRLFGDAAQLKPLEEEEKGGAGPPVSQMRAAAADEEAHQLKAQPGAGRGGLPAPLRAGVEALSGLSLSHVKVHYGSDRPAQLNALAYAQGADIHLAPGQEAHLPHEAWHVVQQAQGRVRPTLQMKGGVPINDDAGLEREADIMGARALALQDSAPRALSPAGAGAAQSAVQRYKRREDGINVSENDQFAVQGEGPGSKLFIAEGVDLPALQHVVFKKGEDHLALGALNLQGIRAEFKEHDEMAAMFCGKFSHLVTGVTENVENDKAPPGRSLYVNNLFAIESGYKGAWINHFAPVILADGGDRGTLETAVFIDHIWFGIYGNVVGQSFRYKTIVADINLQLKRGIVSRELAATMLEHLENFSKNPDVVDKTAPADVLDEAKKIKSQLQQVVDIGAKRPAATELPSETKRRTDAESLELQKSVADLVTDIRGDKGGWRDRVAAAHRFTLQGLIKTALEAPDLNPAERGRLLEAKAMGAEVSTMSGDTRPDSGAASSGPSMLMIIGGVSALAIIGSLLYYASRKT